MCGICGVAHADPSIPVSSSTLSRMRASLAHRGPDGFGEHILNGVGLAHTRLSIIDVVGGRQPLCNEDGSVWVTFNGELYNYKALRDQLRARGHTFKTDSDTEVLVHLYEEDGPSFVRRLNGMFALAIHDVREQRVVLARDHFGIKPLFYSVQDESLVFGSEVKAVLAGRQSNAETTSTLVQEYLLFRCCTGDRSFFSGVKRLPPGSIALWQGGRLSLETYWTPPAPRVADHISLDEAASSLEALLAASVQSQMMSEVPLGTYCSGGVDSGLTSVYAARYSTQRLQTFSVGFRESLWDETPLARDTARRIGSDHHVLVADATAYVNSLPKLIWNHDEPLGHPNSVLIALLSAFARQHVTVVLTGEGSDELFGGYPRHHVARMNALVQNWPMWLRAGGANAFRRLGGRRGGLLADSMSLSFPEAVVMNSSYVSPDVVERLTGSAPIDSIETRMREAESLYVAGNPAASISRYDQRNYLPCLLDRMDRMTMASGLEGRVPFLDVSLAEWASGLPAAYRLGAFGNKRVVKRLGERYLSRKITHGPKSGFGVPIGDWLRTPAWSEIVERLRDSRHPATGVVDGREVRALVDAHLSGRQGLSDVLWLLVNLYLWHETKFVASEP